MSESELNAAEWAQAYEHAVLDAYEHAQRERVTTNPRAKAEFSVFDYLGAR